MELTQEKVFDNFRGKPYKTKIKGTDDKDYDVKFEQFDAENLARLTPLINKYLKISMGKEEKDTKFVDTCIPWIDEMLKMSYGKDNKIGNPVWTDEGMILFRDNNLFWLIETMFEANLMQLYRAKKDSIEEFVEEKRKQLEKEAKDGKRSTIDASKVQGDKPTD